MASRKAAKKSRASVFSLSLYLSARSAGIVHYFFTGGEVLTILHTDRLRLVVCPPESALLSVGDRAAFESLLDVRLHASWPPVDMLDFLPVYAAMSDPGDWGLRLMSLRPCGTVIGSLGFIDRPDPSGTVELGYGIVPEYQRRGYSFEAVSALVSWALGPGGAERVSARCEPENAGSIRILQKLGMLSAGTRDGLLAWELPKKTYLLRQG